MLTSLVLTYGNRRNGNVEARLSKDDGKMWHGTVLLSPSLCVCRRSDHPLFRLLAPIGYKIR